MTYSGGPRVNNTLQEVQDRTVAHHETVVSHDGLLRGQVCLLSLLSPVVMYLGTPAKNHVTRT